MRNTIHMTSYPKYYGALQYIYIAYLRNITMIQTQTINITNYKHFRAISMDWSKHVDKHDIKVAFQDITAQLDAEPQPICIVVDLRDNTFMPLAETFKGAVWGPHRHPNLAAWLVIGENTFARYVAGMLDRFGEDKAIKWFANEVEVDAYLEEHCPYA